MSKRIVFKNTDGTVGIIIPTQEWNEDMQGLAEKDVPAGLEWRIADVADLPQSRNYRNAWTDDNPTTTVDVDLEKAKPIQKKLAADKARERVEKDLRGQPKPDALASIDAEIEAIDFTAATTLDELYNMWPASIEKRTGPRQYKIHK